MDYEFQNLLGAPYRGGTLLLHGTKLISPAGNRLTETELTLHTTTTYPFQNLTNIAVVAINDAGTHMLSFDEDGRALFVNARRRSVLHHMRFKGRVAAARFSPSGSHFAVCVGKLLQVWRTPALAKEFTPFALHRTYGGPFDDLTCVDWSADGRWLLAAGRDLTARVFSLDPVPGYEPPTLSGHREKVVACFWGDAAAASAFTASRDGALFHWARDASAPVVSGGEGAEPSEADGHRLAQWALKKKHFFFQSGAKLTCAAFHLPSALLCAGFSSGVFTLHRLPDFEQVHTLSVSSQPVTSCAFGAGGAWLALGCASLGQLLVWEWGSETYVLKQQGHAHDVNVLAYSPDGSALVTGADDSKVKVWTVRTGACFVTFKDHTAPVSAVAFLPAGHAVLSASLDGTVRAFDLVRYRNFRTLTAPEPCQFASLAVDPAGELVCAGTMDTFQILVWSLKTGRLLDVLQGHAAPVTALHFSPTTALLASGSWDKTVRLWDVFESKGAVETLSHVHDVLAVAFRPDGKQLCSSALDGQLFFWSAKDGVLQGTIEGRRDVAGGRARGDRRTAANNSSGQCFTSVCYNADGTLLLAGGKFKYVCVYDAAERTLLRRVQLTINRSVDGVLDELDSRRLTDAGPLELLPPAESDSDDGGGGGGGRGEALPGAGAKGGAGAGLAKGGGARPAIRAKCVRLSPTGQTFSAATSEGVMVFILDREALFDPSDLGEDVTPEACESALRAGLYPRALLLALRLNSQKLLRRCVEGTPPPAVAAVASAVPAAYLPRTLSALADLLDQSPHLEHLLSWLRAVFAAHGRALQDRAGGGVAGGDAGPAMTQLVKALARIHGDLGATAGTNLYTLEYITKGGWGGGKATQPEAGGGKGGTAGDSDGDDGDDEWVLAEAVKAGMPHGRAAAAGSSSSDGEEEEEEQPPAASARKQKKVAAGAAKQKAAAAGKKKARGAPEEEAEDGDDGEIEERPRKKKQQAAAAGADASKGAKKAAGKRKGK